MEQEFCINKSGSTIPIYKYDYVSPGEKNEVVGRIYPNECFTFYNIDTANVITFLNSSGSLANGFIPLGNSVPSSFYSSWNNYGFKTHTVGRYTYHTFKLRRSAEVFDSSGNKIGDLSSGSKVIGGDASGETHPDWLRIYYLEDASGNRTSITFNGTPYTWAYVDSGLSRNSSGSSITVYGNW